MSLADELERLDALRKAGTLSDDEFARAKYAVLAGPVGEPSADLVRLAELDRIDREWQLERERLMVPGRQGSQFVPRPWVGVLSAAVGGGFGTLWTLGAFSLTNGRAGLPLFAKFVPLFGLIVTVAAVWHGFSIFMKGIEYNRAFAEYRRRRAEV